MKNEELKMKNYLQCVVQPILHLIHFGTGMS